MLNFYTFTLPFKKVFKTGAGDFLERSGIIIQYSDSKFEVLAEASPLPGFSVETLQQVKKNLIRHHKFINNFFSIEYNLEELRDFLQTIPDLASLQFAISYIGLKILSHRNQQPVSKILGFDTPDFLKINDVIGNGNHDNLEKQIRRSIRQGFITIKIKTPEPTSELASVLTNVYQSEPTVIFRLDANQSWKESELKSATLRFKHLPIEYIEEPVQIKNPQHLASLSSKSHIPIAIDESVSNPLQLRNFLQYLPNNYYVIKPQLYGNLLDLHETISHQGTQVKMNIVITTLLESGVGRGIIAEIAAIFGNPDLSHGLHTGSVFNEELYQGFTVKNGILSISENYFRQPSFKDLSSNFLLRFL